jgi:hypothetical protein
MLKAILSAAGTFPPKCRGAKLKFLSERRPKSNSALIHPPVVCTTAAPKTMFSSLCRYLRLNERQAAEIQRAVAAAEDADSATSVVRAQMERLRLQMETQGAELNGTRRQLQEKTEQLEMQVLDQAVRLQELQSQRDALAKALRQSRTEADAAAREAQESNARKDAVEAAFVSMGEQVAEYECAKESILLQQHALVQQQQVYSLISLCFLIPDFINVYRS